MAPLKALIALSTRDNDYQRAQAASAEAAAAQHGVELEITYANSDAVYQIEQILTTIQRRDHGISIVITQPAGTGMVNVAEACAKAGIAWALLSRQVDYIGTLRAKYQVPIFEVTVDQLEIGHIHAQQIAAILPKGGNVLYLAGPASGTSSRLRADGLAAKKPSNVELKTLRGSWTDESGHRAVSSWLKLSTSKSSGFSAIISQNDAMAVGARRAFSEVNDTSERANWMQLPILGCDGLPETGQQYIKRGLLTATIATPAVAGMALDLFMKWKKQGASIPDRTLASSASFPALEALHPKAMAHSL
jgi:ribose transport system substrate-binding protein